MLLGIPDLENVTVNDIMIPRNEVFGIDLDDNLDQIIWQLRTTTHTRLPLYRENINQIIGVIHMRQIARLLTLNKLTHADLHEACTDPYFVPESAPHSTHLMNFQKHKRRIGIVEDEYGDVEGVVTLEDILEEIVDEFSDQDNHNSPEIHQHSDGSYTIVGAAYIRDINKALEWDLPSDGPKTLNGLITEVLEFIPEGAVCIQVDAYYLETLEIKDNRVSRARLWSND